MVKEANIYRFLLALTGFIGFIAALVANLNANNPLDTSLMRACLVSLCFTLMIRFYFNYVRKSIKDSILQKKALQGTNLAQEPNDKPE